jgi:hypothetical protein
MNEALTVQVSSSPPDFFAWVLLNLVYHNMYEAQDNALFLKKKLYPYNVSNAA